MMERLILFIDERSVVYGKVNQKFAGTLITWVVRSRNGLGSRRNEALQELCSKSFDFEMCLNVNYV